MISFLIFLTYFIGCYVSFTMIKNRNKTLPYNDTMSFSDAVGNSLFSWLTVLIILLSKSNIQAKFNKYCEDFERGDNK